MSNLKEMIDRYGNLNAEYKSYEKQLNEDKEAIKKIMTEAGDEKAEGDEYKVTCKVIDIEKFNNDRLVNKLHSMWAEEHGSITCPYTKIIYVPDMDEIEKAIYNGEIDAKDLIDCKDITTQTRLTVSKIKK